MTDVKSLAQLEEREPWDQLEGEPDHAYQTFLLFRDDRSHRMRTAWEQAKTRLTADVCEQTVYRWREQYNWVERARAWTQRLQRLEDEAKMQAIVDMNARHVTEGKLAQAVGVQKMKQMLDNPDQIKDMNPQTGGQLMQIGAQMERAALGLSEGREAHKGLNIAVVINMPKKDGEVIEGEARETE